MYFALEIRNSRLDQFRTQTDRLSHAMRHFARMRRPFFILAAMFVVTFLLTGCGDKKKSTSRRLPPPPTIPSSNPDSTARRIPPPSTPTTSDDDEDLAKYAHAKVLWTETGYASWYGPPYHNQRGANGQVYNMHAMTAAHKTLPLNSIVRVTNLKTNQQAILRITDRGPFVGDRVIDLSMAAAKALDVWRPGTAKVRIEALETPSPIETGGRWCVQVGAFTKEQDAIELKSKLQRRYRTAKVLEFAGPTGYWVRVRVLEDKKERAQEVAQVINVDEGGVFLVRLD